MDYASDLLLGDLEDKPETLTPKKEIGERVNYADSLLLGDLGPTDSWVGDKPLNSVLTTLKKQKKSASFVTNLVAGIADDPKTQMRVYAAARFPNMPESERLKRYGVSNGEIVYMGDDGDLYRETADTFWQEAKRFAAQTGSHAPSIVMGIIGSLGGPGTAALGAAGGEGIRKSIAATALGEQQTGVGNALSMAKEGAFAYGGDVAGMWLSRGVNYLGAKRGGRLAAEAGMGRKLIDVEKTRELEQLSKKFGIDLFTPQTTGSKKLVAKFNLLGDLESSADMIQKAKIKQLDQIDTAVYNYFKRLAPKKMTQTKIGGRLVEVSKKGVMKPVLVRQAKASPIYEKAFESNVKVDVEPVIKWIEEGLKTQKGDIRKALLKSKNLLLKPDLPQKTPAGKILDVSGNPFIKSEKVWDTSVKGLHGTKVSLDAAIQGSKQGNVRYIYNQVQKKLLKQIDDVSPLYKKARSVYGEYSDEVAKQGRKTILGDISKLEGDKVVNATKKMFASQEVKAAPEIVTKIKKVIQQQDPEIWDSAISSHLQSLFEATKQSATGDITNVGGNFYKKVWGDTAQRKVLEAAMSPEQYKTMSNFMRVLQRTGLILGKESQTATRQQMLEEIGGRGIRAAVRALTRPLITKEKVIGDRLLEISLYKNANNLAEAMISDKAAKQLAKMVQLGDTAEKALPMMTNFLGQVINGEYSRNKTQDIKPDIIKQLGLKWPPVK